MHKTRRIFVLTGLGLVLMSGCGGGGSALNPNFQPEVANLPDNFQFQATGVNGVTQTLQYTWQNSGTAASVNQATTRTSGSATLTIRDAASTQVYQGDLNGNGTFATSAGQTGGWTIQVALTNFSGTLNFRVQKS